MLPSLNSTSDFKIKWKSFKTIGITIFFLLILVGFGFFNKLANAEKNKTYFVKYDKIDDDHFSKKCRIPKDFPYTQEDIKIVVGLAKKPDLSPVYKRCTDSTQLNKPEGTLLSEDADYIWYVFTGTIMPEDY